VFLAPLYYVHLSFPQAIQGTDLREALRVKVNIPAQVTASQAGGEKAAVAASLTNLSITGALIQAQQWLGGVADVVGVSFAFLAQPGSSGPG
jgi:hypothetical protein